MIQNYFFDMGGVLMDLDVDRTLKAISTMIDPSGQSGSTLSPQDLFGVGENKLIQDYQDGVIGTDGFIDAMRQVFHFDFNRQAILNAWNAMLLGIPLHRLEALRMLRSKGCGVYILSNINEEHLRWTREHFAQIGLREGVDVCQSFFSNEMGMSKPDPRIYREAIRRASVDPQTTLYIDDMQVNVDAGRACGLQARCAAGDSWLELI